jgi:hypothetical protein
MSFAGEPNNWTLNSYTTSTWTTLVNASGDSVINSVYVSTGSTSPNFQLRVANSGGTDLALLIPSLLLTNNYGYQMLQGPITLQNGQLLQVWADQSGCEFAAFGAD